MERQKSRVIEHMNQDHSKSLLAYAHHYAGKTQAIRAKMTDLTPEGWVLTVTLRSGEEVESVLAPFKHRLRRAGDVRKLAVDMHREAFENLGFLFKLQHGFWGNKPQKYSQFGLVLAIGIAVVVNGQRNRAVEEAAASDAGSDVSRPSE